MGNPFEAKLKKLSDIHSDHGCAISFYYFPKTPQNKAHREQAIVLKEVLRDTKRRLEAEGKREALSDIERLSTLAEQLARNGRKPLAVFACAEKGVWEQVELAAGQMGETAAHVNSRFHLRPLALANTAGGSYLIVVADRLNVHFIRYSLGELNTFDRIESELPRKTKTDGFGGYDAGHKERHVENWEMRHFKEMSEKLKQFCEGGSFDGVIIACRAEVRPEIEPHLHTYVSDKLISYIDADPAMLSEESLRGEVDRVIAERRAGEQQALVREAIGEAQRNALGALGLKNVLQSLERGEVQTLIIGPEFSARAIECTNCGHLDTRNSVRCPLCSQPVREIEDVADALVSRALRSNIDVSFVDDEEFVRAGNIAALLRFRADQNTPAKLAS